MRVIASATLGLLLAACMSTGGRTYGVTILNPELRLANVDYAATMTAARPPLRMGWGGTASTCAEYLAMRDGIDVTNAPDYQTASLEYVVCDSLAALRGVSPVRAAGIHPHLGQALATRLDLRSFRSSKYQRTTDEAYTLKALADHPLLVSPYGAELASRDWYFKLEVVAIADIDASGRPDWLIWVTDQALNGTYLTVTALLIHDPEADGMLNARPLLP